VKSAACWRALRPGFLPLTGVSVTLGLAVAWLERGTLHLPQALLSLGAALWAHAAVNALNEYHDFVKGVDHRTRRTPFSGGSGVLVSGLTSPGLVLGLGLGCLASTTGLGLYLAYHHGWEVLALGAIGISLVLLYTPLLTRHPLAGLAAPGLGFGPLMVAGVHRIQTGCWSAAATTAAVMCGFLASALLLLNQYPDLEADAATGRRNYLMLWGRRRATGLYALLLAGAYLAVVAAVLLGVMPANACLALLTSPLAVHVALRLPARTEDREALLPLLLHNVLIVLFTPLLAALGMALGRPLP